MSDTVLRPSASARRWARREVARLLASRADAGLTSTTIGPDGPSYGLEFGPALAEVVAGLTPDRTIALVEDLLLLAHLSAAMLATAKGGHARDHAPAVVHHMIDGLDRFDPIVGDDRGAAA